MCGTRDSFHYNASWQQELEKWRNRRFKIYEQVFSGGRYAIAEVIFSYPEFQSVEEGLKYIREILDGNFTGKYGIVDTYANTKRNSPEHHSGADTASSRRGS